MEEKKLTDYFILPSWRIIDKRNFLFGPYFSVSDLLKNLLLIVGEENVNIKSDVNNSIIKIRLEIFYKGKEIVREVLDKITENYLENNNSKILQDNLIQKIYAKALTKAIMLTGLGLYIKNLQPIKLNLQLNQYNVQVIVDENNKTYSLKHCSSYINNKYINYIKQVYENFKILNEQKF